MDTNLTIRRVALSGLHFDPANARSHDERNLDAIAASLRQFGQAEPLVVQRGTGRVIGGNGRLAAMKGLGWAGCDVVELDVDATQAVALGIALNRTGELASWDMPALSKILESFKGSEVFDALGFDEKEMGEVLDEVIRAGQSLDGLVEDDVPAPPEEATTRLGDLWVLGRHRLLCGDSSKRENLLRLLDGATVQLVNTDPPYNVAVEPRSNAAIAAGLSSFPASGRAKDTGAAGSRSDLRLRPKDRPIANDCVSEEEFDLLLRAWFGNLATALEPGRAFYIWGGYGNLRNYPRAIHESGLYFSQALIWVKNHPVLGRKDFMSGHEWAYYGWREGAAHTFLGPNNATDVWHVKKLHHSEMVHLTEKPVELAARAMQYSSRPGENVLDLFGGSGSTLIAAEQTQRRAYVMELDPLYCDVIVERWQALTGAEARLVGTGETFASVRRSRVSA